jgi:dipeptidyl aminopeptidase/acylaminoacyl peptidase
VYAAQGPQESEEIWIAGADFKNPRRLTHLNPQLDQYALGASRLIEWRSLDGQKLRGALLLPAGFEPGKRYPLIVDVYGGSNGSNNVNTFGLNGSGAQNMQLLATRGYAVLLPDAPLRVGTPMQDLAKTVLPGVDKVIELGVADPDRLGVMGHSYGGYSVLALIVQTTQFRAAVSSGGYGDLISEYGAMRKDGSTYFVELAEESQGRMGGTPWQFRDRYIENSPFFYLDRVQTPLLLIHGAVDVSAPASASEEIFVGLRRLGKEVLYAKYEGESHFPGVWGYDNQIDYWNRVIDWFDSHLVRPQ